MDWGNFNKRIDITTTSNRFEIAIKGIVVKDDVYSKYENSLSFRAGYAAVKLDGKWGFIDNTGKEVISIKYEDVRYFKKMISIWVLDGVENKIIETLAAVKLNGKWGFIDNYTYKRDTKPERIPLKYDNLRYEFRYDGFAGVTLGNKRIRIDKDGKEYEINNDEEENAIESAATMFRRGVDSSYDY